jgi:hypothetical protein
LTNSGDLRRSSWETGIVAVLLSALIAAVAAWVYRHGHVLDWGDAQAHLNASRSLVDSRTPGYDQLGTVWLPVLHVICVPLVGNDSFWSSGLAGTIPVSICFVVAGVCLYLAAREAYGNSVSAAIVLACFALNPNVLYLASIPMTEIVFLAGLFATLFCLLRFRATQERRYLLIGVVASWWMSLTRYDGWFLIPFVALSFALFATKRRWWILMGFGLAASLAPCYWIAHNWWETSNPLDFYNGPYSAAAIQGPHDYPGYHHWTTALRYYFEAGKLCSGLCLILLGCAGIACAIGKRIIFPIAFLSLTPIFYVWSVHSSKLPIHAPSLWPNSYYNNRYGIAVLVLAAFACGAIALVLPARARLLGFAAPALCVMIWAWRASPEKWIIWKESQVNSVSRREWRNAAASFLKMNYRPGEGILTGTGDLPGIYCQAGVPFRETLNIGNGVDWLAATSRPDLIHRERWALVQDNDFVWRALQRSGSPYRLVWKIEVKGAPALEIYKR